MLKNDPSFCAQLQKNFQLDEKILSKLVLAKPDYQHHA
ncbi:hypothetical protein Q669_29105 [Labrenzia sp. C1B10]|nr:hypothetical protein Q669_29105 [Labrenzia sp. C1B10]ERS06949.1 hypothetical protein Q675_24965 [Labrenzia sp. C1B70]